MTDQTTAAVHDAIRRDLGYDLAADEASAAVLAGLLTDGVVSRLSLSGRSVAIVVGANLTATGIEEASRADHVFATGDALERLEVAACWPTLVVTDLDSEPARVCARTHLGGLVAIHAHGDNQSVIEEWVPRMNQQHVIGTAQVTPAPSPLLNPGGFTDGDRTAYLADSLGVGSLSLIGWDLDDPTVSVEKARKLAWARQLLCALASRRGESYEAIDEVP